MDNKVKLIRKLVIFFFAAVPIASATVSAFHIERFLALGNPTALSVSLALVYELANLTTTAIFVILNRVRKGLVWTSFSILILMQIIGNIYYSYNYININMAVDASWVTNFIKMMATLFPLSNDEAILYLSIAIGAPVPIIALLLTKSISDYLGDEENVAKEQPPIDKENMPEWMKDWMEKYEHSKINQEKQNQSVALDLIPDEPLSKPDGLEIVLKPEPDTISEEIKPISKGLTIDS